MLKNRMLERAAVSIGVACLVAVGLAFVCGAFDAEIGARAAIGKAGSVDPRANEPSASPPPIREEVSAPEHSGRWLTVVTDAGAPIPRARVYALPDASRRWLCSEPVTETGADGTAGIPEAPERERVGHLLVCRDGYEAAVVAPERDWRGGLTVCLVRTQEQAVFVRTRAGSLVADVTVLASTSPLGEARPAARDAASWVPVPGPGGAVHRSVSDAYGRARFGSLARGRYHLAIVHERWWLSLPGRIAMPELPGEPVYLEVVEPHVAVARLAPAVPRERVSIWGAGLDADAFRGSDYQALLTGLEGRYPELKAFVGVRSDGRATPIELRGEAITEQGARATFGLTARTLSEFDGPTDVTLTILPGEVGGSIRVSVGPSLEPFAKDLTARAWIGDFEGLRALTIGGSSPVPAGKYVVEPGPSWIGRLVESQEVVVAAGTEVEVRFEPEVPFRVVEFRTVVPSGMSVPGIRLFAVDTSGEREVTQASHSGKWTGSCRMLLPAGSYEVRAMTQDYHPESVPIAVVAGGSDPMRVDIHLRPKRKD